MADDKKTKRKGRSQVDAESIETARDAEAASAEQASQKPVSELDQLSGEILTSLAGESLPADRLSTIQEKIFGMETDEQDKLKESISRGVVDHLTSLEAEALSKKEGRDEPLSESRMRELRERHQGDAEEISELIVTGFLEEGDLETLMSEMQKDYERRARRARLEGAFKHANCQLPKLIGGAGGALAGLGVYGLLSDDEKRLIDTCKDEETMNQYVKEFIGNHAEELGIDDAASLDVDDLAILAEYQAEQNAPTEVRDDLLDTGLQKDLADRAISNLPVVGEATTLAAILNSCKYVALYGKASRELGVKKKVLRYFSVKTYKELCDELEGQDHTEGRYAEIALLKQAIEAKRDFLEEELKKSILSLKDEDLSDDDKIALMAEYNLDSMQIGDIILLMYGGDGERENWLPHSISRLKTINRGYYNWFGHKNQYTYASGTYAAGWATRSGPQAGLTREIVDRYRFLRREIKDGAVVLPGRASGELQTLQKEIDALEGRVSDFTKRMDPSNPASFGSKIENNAMLERDRLLKQLHVLSSKKASMVLTEASKNTLHSGRFIDMLETSARSGSVNLSTALGSFDRPDVAKSFVEGVLGKGKSTLALDDIQKLKSRYVSDISDIRRLKDTWEGAFNGFAKSLHGEGYSALQKGVRAGTTQLDDIQRKAAYVSGLGKAKYWAPRLVIPIAIVGTELYGLATGNVRKEEVAWDLAEAGACFIPVVGTTLDFKAYFTGKSLSGRDLGGWSSGERLAYLAGGAVGAFADVMTVFGGVGLGIRAGVATMRGAAKAGRGARTLSRYGSVPFRLGSKVSDAFYGLSEAGRIGKLKSLQNIEDGLELSRLRKMGEAGRKAAGVSDRFEHLHHLEEAGEIGKQFGTANWFTRRWHEARLGVSKGAHRLIGGVPDASATARQIDRANDTIVDARRGLVDAKKAVDALDAAGELKTSVKYTDALAAVSRAEKAVDVARKGKHLERAERDLRRIGNVHRYRYLDMASNYVFWGGCAAGGLMALTAFNTEEVLDTAVSAGKVAATPVKWGWDAMWDEHGSYSPIQKAILARSYVNRTTKKIDQRLAKARENGEDEMGVWKDLIVNKRNRVAMELAQKRGIDISVMLAELEHAASADVATGDSDQKTREAIA